MKDDLRALRIIPQGNARPISQNPQKSLQRDELFQTQCVGLDTAPAVGAGVRPSTPALSFVEVNIRGYSTIVI